MIKQTGKSQRQSEDTDPGKRQGGGGVGEEGRT